MEQEASLPVRGAAAPQAKPGLGRDFLWMFTGQAMSMQGDGLANLAVLWWIAEETQSVTASASLALLATLPIIFLGPVAGVVVDRYSRRTLMMIADVVRAIGWGVVAWSMIRGEMTLAVLLAVAAVSATCRTFHRPALQASIAQLVPEQALNRANSLFQMAEAGANLIAPAVGGALVAWLGAGAAVAVSALTCAVAAATLLLVALPPLAPKPVPRRGAISSANWATGWPTSGRDSACCSSCCARLRWSTSPWRPSGRCCRSWRNTAWAPTPAALAC